ncbi:MAG: DNA-directed RNA polymerase subunit omega [Gammaproteobacteria bacterium]|nr:DNA-directed RNA polymerase subunit omega [Gammaproteobacteria bacterium]
MARVTVEDCLHGVENLFQLVLVASRRARQIYAGSEMRVSEDGDKPTVVALREIAEGLVGPSVLDEKIIPDSERDEPDQPETSFASAAEI